MGKANRATRKELEEVVGKLVQEVLYLKQVFTAMDNYLGAYVQFKGDNIEFNNYLKKEIEKTQANVKTPDIQGGVKNDKKDRYKKVVIPPL